MAIVLVGDYCRHSANFDKFFYVTKVVRGILDLLHLKSESSDVEAMRSTSSMVDVRYYRYIM